jgi:toxin ParE1/3/4
MANRITWSPRAASHLESICEFIAEDSPVYARIFAQQVITLVKSIPAYPQTGRMVPEYNDLALREKIYGNYRVIYRIKAERIEVVAICHGARLLRSVLPNSSE